MNLMSLVLYTSAFTLIIFRTNIYHLSLDKFFNLDILFTTNENKIGKNKTMQPE